MRVLVLADTHIRTGGSRRLPDEVYAELDRADVILHAGDVTAPELLDELRGFAPVHAVLGNNDHQLFGILPETDTVVLDGVPLALIHDTGTRAAREGRVARRFPDAAVVVYGHSHIPDDSVGLHGQLLFNPGSPTERRAQPHCTYGVLELGGSRLVDHRIIRVGA